MKIANTVCFFALIGSLLVTTRCSRYMLPESDLSSNLSASFSTSSERNTSAAMNNYEEYFHLFREAEDQLRRVVQSHNITTPTSLDTRSGQNKDPKALMFTNLSAVDSELFRLKKELAKLRNQPKPNVSAQSNQEGKLRLEIDNLNSKIIEKDSMLSKKNEEIINLQGQIIRLSRQASEKPISPTPSEIVHSCKVQLKSNNSFTKEIRVKGDVITFNFKFDLKDIRTNHPRNSFAMENSKNATFIVITDSKSFWSSSKELIVWGKKKYHGCIDRDLRKK